ncbi:MAG: zf-HC2 domain-containing protein [bacterium]|jgi:hypothetical protein
MNCERTQEQFSALHEGSISQPLRVALEQHLLQCASCRDEYTEFARAWDLLGTFEAIEPPADLHQTIISRVDAFEWASKRNRPPTWQLFFNRGLAFVGVAAIILFVYLFIDVKSGPREIIRTSITNIFRNEPAPNPVAKFDSPVLETRRFGQTLGYIIRLTATDPLKYAAYVTENASKYNSDMVKSSLSGTVRANGSVDIPLGMTLSSTENSVIWFVYGRDEVEQVTLFIIPSSEAPTGAKSGSFSGTLTQVLQEISIHYGLAVQIDNLTENPNVIIANFEVSVNETVLGALNRTNYQLVDITNGVIHIALKQ